MTTVEKIKSAYLTEEEVCEILGIGKRGLQTRRTRGQDHPPYVRLGKKILFPKKELEAWLNKKELIRAIS